jgi:photosystem II stability/assembly factor-like uncharacterized protein
MTTDRLLRPGALLLAASLFGAPLAAAQEASSPNPLDLESFQWRPLGPTGFGGRIVDLASHPDRPRSLWVASASGGLWVTGDHGTSWRCLFEREGTISIGDVAVDPSNPDVIWVGTGEANNQRSSYWGDGVYKSTDGGETWANVGLGDSHHIGRIVIDPSDPDHVLVAALGHLYTPNQERGLYRTTDGGETWSCVLHVSEDVGVVDVAIDAADPRFVYAASYERRRRAWDFDGNGPGSGIWRSEDGGASFERCAGGLPEGDIGRIGLDIFPGSGEVIATVANQNVEVEVREARPALEAEWKDGALVVTDVERRGGAREAGLRRGDVIRRVGERAIDSGFQWLKVLALVDKDDEAAGETVEVSYERGGEARTTSAPLVDLLIFQQAPRERQVGGEVYRSSDRGVTWAKVNEKPAGGSPAYYYGQVRFDPTDDQRAYMCSVPLYRTEDGGATWDRIAGSVHVDHHAVLVDPADPNKIWLGNDGGLHVSYDRGDSWQHINNLPISQFYAVGLDMSEPFRVYGGTQDNGTWGGPSTSRDPRGIHPSEWDYVGGGDGFYAQIDPRDPSTVYGESQFGAIYRRNMATGTSVGIRPPKPEGAEESALRFNWNSPILISAHNPEIIYFGGNRLFKSFDRGDSWPVHSPDLTSNDAAKIAGNVPHCTITTIAESSIDPGLLLVGTDDGLVQMSSDGGYGWSNLTGQFPGLPSNWWVSRVTLSAHDRGRAYASFTGYREDDFRPLVYATDELGSGKSWRLISAGLEAGGPVNDVIEDPSNGEILFAGTELGAYMSWDRGASWAPLQGALPRVAVHDLALHDRDGELVAATHGRGFWALDVDGLRGVTPEGLAAPFHLLPVGDLTRWARRSAVGGYGGGDSTWRGQNESRDLALWVHRVDGEAQLAVEIRGPRDEPIAFIKVPAEPGMHDLRWDGALDRKLTERRGRAPEGAYAAQLVQVAGGDDEEREMIGEPRRFLVRRDPMLNGATAAEMAAEESAGSTESD